MKFGRILVLSLATLLVAAPAAYAQDDMGDLTTKKPTRKQTVEEENNDPLRSGPMLGIGGTAAIQNFSGMNQKIDTASGGFNIHIGYRYNPRIAADMQVERYQEFDSPTGEVNGWAIGINGKGYLATGTFQPWLLGGLSYLDMETTNSAAANVKKTDDGPALRFGFGLDWYTTPNVVLVTDVSYMLGLSQVEGYDMVLFSLGLMYRP